MTAYLYRAGSGVAGDVTRQQETTVESGLLNSASAPSAFGAPLKLVSGKFEKIAASDTAGVFAGILARVVPAISGDVADTGTPNLTQIQAVVVSGYVNVVCTIGTPVRGGTVYMRNTAASGKLVGDLEATSDAGNVALSGVKWAVDGKDSSNVAEIRIA